MGVAIHNHTERGGAGRAGRAGRAGGRGKSGIIKYLPCNSGFRHHELVVSSFDTFLKEFLCVVLDIVLQISSGSMEPG